MGLQSTLLIIVFSLISTPAFALIPPMHEAPQLEGAPEPLPSPFEKIFPEQLITDAEALQPIQEGTVVPTGMAPVFVSDSAVAKRILDHNVQKFMLSDKIQGSSIARRAKSLEDSMRADISTSTELPNGFKIDHRVIMNFEPFQQVARMKYEGLLNAEYYYHLPSNISSVDFFYELNPDVDLVLQSNRQPENHLNQFIVRMNW